VGARHAVPPRFRLAQYKPRKREYSRGLQFGARIFTMKINTNPHASMPMDTMVNTAPAIPSSRQARAASDEVDQSRTSPQGSGRRIPELDGLRGVAILLVLSLHYVAESGGGEFGSALYRFKQLFRLGWSGVDLFFVLSGFLIGGILLQARDSENYFRIFYTRRVFRIFPIYYSWILLYFLIRTVGSHWIPGSMPVVADGIHRIPVYLLFLQNIFGSLPNGSFDWYWLAVMWSLAVEEQFYLVAPILIRALSRRSLVATLCSTVILAPILRELAYRFTPRGESLWYSLMPCRADALAIGMLAAIAWKTDEIRASLIAQKNSIYKALIFFACGLPVLLKFFPGVTNHFTAVAGYSWLALFYVTLMLAILADPNGKLGSAMRSKWLMRLGGISYCVYLIHFPVNGILHSVLLGSRPSIAGLSGVSVTLLAAAVTVGLALLSWEYFEGPLLRLGHRYKYRMTTE
jgi:peptidoglycan/LPS O-acetylase OafA/YrhL